MSFVYCFCPDADNAKLASSFGIERVPVLNRLLRDCLRFVFLPATAQSWTMRARYHRGRSYILSWGLKICSVKATKHKFGQSSVPGTGLGIWVSCSIGVCYLWKIPLTRLCLGLEFDFHEGDTWAWQAGKNPTHSGAVVLISALGPVVRVICFLCRMYRFDPWLWS